MPFVSYLILRDNRRLSNRRRGHTTATNLRHSPNSIRHETFNKATNLDQTPQRARFGKQDFVYLPEEDVYRCPAGEKLTYRYTTEENGLVLRRYWTNACQSCAIKNKCTTGKERRIARWEHGMSIFSKRSAASVRIFSGCWSSRRCTASRTCSCSHRVIRRSLPVVQLCLMAQLWQALVQ